MIAHSVSVPWVIVIALIVALIGFGIGVFYAGTKQEDADYERRRAERDLREVESQMVLLKVHVRHWLFTLFTSGDLTAEQKALMQELWKEVLS